MAWLVPHMSSRQQTRAGLCDQDAAWHSMRGHKPERTPFGDVWKERWSLSTSIHSSRPLPSDSSASSLDETDDGAHHQGMQTDGQANGMVFLYIDPLTEHIPTSKSLTIPPLQIPMPLRHRATSCDPASSVTRENAVNASLSLRLPSSRSPSPRSPSSRPPSLRPPSSRPPSPRPPSSRTAFPFPPHHTLNRHQNVQPSSSPGSTNVTLAFFLGLGPSGPPSSSSSSSSSSST